jgi:hypothetical protein
MAPTFAHATSQFRRYTLFNQNGLKQAAARRKA